MCWLDNKSIKNLVSSHNPKGDITAPDGSCSSVYQTFFEQGVIDRSINPCCEVGKEKCVDIHHCQISSIDTTKYSFSSLGLVDPSPFGEQCYYRGGHLRELCCG